MSLTQKYVITFYISLISCWIAGLPDDDAAMPFMCACVHLQLRQTVGVTAHPGSVLVCAAAAHVLHGCLVEIRTASSTRVLHLGLLRCPEYVCMYV